jgi:hypothetical protein
MSESQRLLERARVVGRVADHLVPRRSGEPVRVLVLAESLVFAAEFAADVAAATRLRGATLAVDAGRLGDPVAPGWDEVIALSGDEPGSGASIAIAVNDDRRLSLARVGSPGVPVHLFSYGTLQQEEVQRTQFGRVLSGSPDMLTGHRSDWVQITDPEVIAASGTDRHPIVRPTGEPSDSVPGTLFEITAVELAAADTYEVDDYRRFQVELISGTRAWIYLAADFASSVAE